jgi:V/A-type H+-transporting ATPase subunit A
VSGALWALDSALAYRRHYPSVNWNRSYTLYYEGLKDWFEQNAPTGWNTRRQQAATLLQREAELQDIVQLVGPDALQDMERLVLEVSRLIREVFLQQSAFSANDASCELEKCFGLLEMILVYHEECEKVLRREVPLTRISELTIREDIARLKEEPNDGFTAKKDACIENFKKVLGGLEAK